MGTPARLHVVQALASRGEGGRELAPLLLASGLKKRGHRVSLWADPGTFVGQKAREQGLLTQSFRFHGFFNLGGVREIRQALRKESPDVIHLHHTRDLRSIIPALALSGWKGPLVITKHVASKFKKVDLIHRWLYQRVDKIFTCSDFIRQNVIETCPVRPEKVETSYMPVDRKIFRFQVSARKSLRKSWGWEGNEIVGMLSRITPRKGHELFLHLAAQLLAKRPDIRFRVAGKCSPREQWYFDQLLKLRGQLGLENVFIYEGYVPDTAAFFSATDLVVHAAEAESFGMAVIEAMACGRPVVVRRGGGLPKILESSPGKAQGGVILNTDDPLAWAETLNKVLDSKALMAKFRRETRKIALRFSLEPWVDRHLQWYRQLLDGKRPTH